MTVNIEELDQSLRGRYPVTSMRDIGYEQLCIETDYTYFEGHDVIVKWNYRTNEFWVFSQEKYKKQLG